MVVPAESPTVWESEIEALERADRERPPRPGAVAFAGSSSIRGWSTLARDMAPLEVSNRGFGGAQADAVLHYARRLILPHSPGGLVLYVGENDLEPHNEKTPERVAADVRALLLLFERWRPGAPVYVMSVKPSPARAALWESARRLNELYRMLVAESPRRRYVDVAAPSFDGGGRRRDLFLDDGLHLSPAGYALWASIVRPRLLADLAPERSP